MYATPACGRHRRRNHYTTARIDEPHRFRHIDNSFGEHCRCATLHSLRHKRVAVHFLATPRYEHVAGFDLS